ncbi:sugar-transfer associated ATP-grasp domain-containing protein [Aquimarina agarilytica]|uniref:sugar-transfer associated ATP-grasp domain-containing protein n=1 Tax=Aquimarina agarilytica TaxID=1087449 RepID=UPI00067FCD52|nr:sugar-transfer associated ATP-grasp domain-containing protein [Aquimarina agarilytica]
MKQKIYLLKKRLLVITNDTNRKGIIQIIKEAIIFGIKKKEFPYFYFGKFLYRKNSNNYLDYLSSAEVDKITLSKKLHHFQYASLLRNKLAFSLFMEKNSLPTPALLSYNFKSRFFNNSITSYTNSQEHLKYFFERVFKESNTNQIFVKSITEMGGNGCFLLTDENLKNELAIFGSYILENDCIHQEVIEQHEKINKIYKYSVNTIRFDTYIDKHNQIHILSAFMRFGRGGNVVDNGSSGGFYVSVDLEEGKLKGKSHQLMKYGGEQLTSHPDTGVVFDGFEIPFFNEACDLIKKAVLHIPDRIIGWDIAISPSGPVIIEGNDNNSFVTPDIAYGGYLKHPLFKEIMSEA